MSRPLISQRKCEQRFPSHIARKYGGEAPHASSAPCARCGVNVAGGLAVGFTDEEIWREETTR